MVGRWFWMVWRQVWIYLATGTSPKCGTECKSTTIGLMVDCKEFEHELTDMGCVLARSCDSCTHKSEVLENKLTDMGCVLARSCEEEEEVELADMGCVLARGCDSCTHESEFLEGELADTGCVLARDCESCAREPWFCGLKFGEEVGLGDSSNSETRFVNDPSRDLCATVPMKVVLVRAHDWFNDHSEVSVEQQIEPYLKFLRLLLSQVADNTYASWWLLDSGASTSVLAESNLSAFRSVLQDSEGLDGYKACQWILSQHVRHC